MSPPQPTTSASASLREHHAQLTQQLDAYYDRTKLLAVVDGFVRVLTERFATHRLVPLNPYAPLLAYVRQAEISAHELLVTPRPRDLKTLESQEVLLFDPRDGRPAVALAHQIATFKAVGPAPALAVWGRRSVVERIPYSSEWQAEAEDVYSLVSPWLRESETIDESCGVLSVGAMVGARVFFLGASPHGWQLAARHIELERHVIVAGDQLELAMAVFARQQIRTLFEATKKQATVPLPDGGQLTLIASSGIVVSSRTRGSTRERMEGVEIWTLERMTANRQAFVTAVKMALVASGSFTIDLIYERRFNGSPDDSPDGSPCSIVRCSLGFIFHFDGSQPPAGPPMSKAPRAEDRSFVDLSRIERSGIFWSPRAANEISRRILEQRERDAGELGARSGGATVADGSLLSELVSRVDQLTRASGEARHWYRMASSTTVFGLVQLTSLVEEMIHNIENVSALSICHLIRSSLAACGEAFSELLQDAAVGRSSSLLRGLQGILKELCSLPDEPVEPSAVDSLYQYLKRSHDAIKWLAGAAVRDFSQLVHHSITNPDEDKEATAMADLRADISAAIEQRRFPSAIVAESVFAQYLVETRVDVALERALVNTVTSGLPPNPFVSFCGHLRVFASQFVGAQQKDGDELSSGTEPSVRPVGGGLFATDIASTATAQSVVTALVAANERILQHTSIKRVLAIHQYLSNNHVFRTAVYHPSKATYSVRVVASLVVDDPLLVAAAEQLDGLLFQSVEVVEHIVIEGKELVQALQFFADAVRRDAARLLEQTSVELKLLVPSGDVITPVELHDLQAFQQLIVEATPKQCVFQVAFPPAVRIDPTHTEPIVRLVTKTYVFRHMPIESIPNGACAACISDSFRLRLRVFGVGFNVEAAQFAWDFAQMSGVDDAEWATLTEYAPSAIQRQDELLLHHIARIAEPADSPPREARMLTSPLTLLYRLLDMERTLEWLLHRLVFQQQTNLTPRSEATSLVADAKTLLTRVASTVERVVVPVVVAMGMVDARNVVEALASVRAFCGDTPSSDSDQLVIAAERLTRRLWTLVLLVRFSSQADS